jgi:glycosyltransferase involved in cell wall biosynthesis
VRVLFVTDSPTYSGAESVLLPCITRLPGEPHVFLPSWNVRLREKLERHGVPYTLSGSFSRRVVETTANPLSLGASLRALLRVGREIHAEIRSRRIDVVHSNSYPASLYSATPAHLTGVRQIWHEHNIKRIHALNVGLYRFVGASSAWIAAPSAAVAGNLERAGLLKTKLRVVYNGIDLERFVLNSDAISAARLSLGLGASERAVGLAGQMLPYKGHRTLIAAAPAVLARFPGTKFFFIGALENEPYEMELRRELAEAGLISRFTFTGWREDMPAVLGAMDVAVTATTTPEPAAVAIQEAMAAGRPVVASRTGGTSELVVENETGLLFDPADAAGAAAQICRVLGDSNMARRFGESGRKRAVASFSQERYVREMHELYASAALNGRRP